MFKQQNQNRIIQSDKDIDGIKNELDEKERENDLIKENLYRSENQRKRLTENIRALEGEILKLKSTILKCEVLNDALRVKLQNLTEICIQAEERGKEYDIVVEELEKVKNDLKIIETKHLGQVENTETLKKMLDSSTLAFDLRKSH